MFRSSAFVLLLLLSACAKPTDGPSAGSISNASLPNQQGRIPIIPLERAPQGLFSGLHSQPAARATGLEAFSHAEYSSDRLQRGDVIEVTVFDT